MQKILIFKQKKLKPISSESGASIAHQATAESTLFVRIDFFSGYSRDFIARYEFFKLNKFEHLVVHLYASSTSKTFSIFNEKKRTKVKKNSNEEKCKRKKNQKFSFHIRN